MNQNLLVSDRVAVVGSIDPDAYGAGTYTTGWVSMADFHSMLAIVQAGTLGSSATLDAKIEQATDGSGTAAKDVAGKAITQLTQGGTDDSDKQALINVRQQDLDIANDFTHVRLSIEIGTATSDAGGLLIATDRRAGAASAGDAASVAEIVA